MPPLVACSDVSNIFVIGSVAADLIRKNAQISHRNRFAEVWAERSVAADVPLLSWYKSNLELSCGVGLDQLGLEWNTDEAYGYEGDHVASTYDSLRSSL